MMMIFSRVFQFAALSYAILLARTLLVSQAFLRDWWVAHTKAFQWILLRFFQLHLIDSVK